jgi:hypothetical protein
MPIIAMLEELKSAIRARLAPDDTGMFVHFIMTVQLPFPKGFAPLLAVIVGAASWFAVASLM